MTTSPRRMNVTLNITPDDRGTYWAGWVEEIGTYVYADDFNGLFPRVQELFNALAHSFPSRESFFGYLDKRGIAYRHVQSGRTSRTPQEIPVLV